MNSFRHAASLHAVVRFLIALHDGFKHVPGSGGSLIHPADHRIPTAFIGHTKMPQVPLGGSVPLMLTHRAASLINFSLLWRMVFGMIPAQRLREGHTKLALCLAPASRPILHRTNVGPIQNSHSLMCMNPQAVCWRWFCCLNA
jgi:hypothetical protein